MAKQNSLVNITGKLDNHSYYHTRNGGFQVRRINPNMSERVKTEETFQNTRFNAREFGASGSIAGACITLMENKYRYILTPIMVGELTKAILRYTQTDTTHDWGKRELPAPYFSTVQGIFNKLLKNPFPGLLKTYIENSIYWSVQGSTIVMPSALNTTTAFEQEWMQRGADGCYLTKYVYQVNPATWNSVLGQYDKAVATMEDYSGGGTFVDFTGTSTHLLISAGNISTSLVPTNSQTRISGVLIIFQPYKKVGSDRQVLSRLCSAYWYGLHEQ